jgi:putative transposase
MKNSYHHNSHSKYLLKVHIVLATKYRKKLLKGSLNEDMKQIIFELSKGQKWSIGTMKSDTDHIHILVDYQPTISVFGIVHRIKQLSTFRIYKSDDYFACSTGDASTETIMEYIRTQG